MASEMLLLLLKLNLAGGAAIIFVLMLRVAMRGWFGTRVAYASWLVVPSTVAAAMLPARQMISADLAAKPVITGQLAIAQEPLPASAPMNAPVDLSLLLMAVWVAGIVLALGLLVRRQAAFTGSLGQLRREAKGVLRADAVGIGPAIIGALRPKLVLPGDFEARFDQIERDVVLAHERIHLKGGDPLVNAFVALAQCVCWFNPLAHVAAHQLRIDQELACDAAVVEQFPKARRSYAEAMLKTQLAPMSLPFGCYWPARAVHPLKQRIVMLKRDLPGEMRAAWGAVAAGIIVLGASVAAWAAQPPVMVVAPPAKTPEANGAELVRAIERWDVAGAMKLIEGGADVNHIRRGDASPLTAAAKWDMMWMTRQLLAHGADPNLPVMGTGTPLIVAARAGNDQIVRELIKAGANVNAYLPMDETALINAARWGQLRSVQVLVEAGADVNLMVPAQPWQPDWFPGSDEMRSPLGEATKWDQRRVAAYLKSKGATM